MPKPGKNLGLGDYGILLYNAPQNTYPTRGKRANKIRGSGIAATREFSSSQPLATTSGTTSKGKAKSVPSGPRATFDAPARGSKRTPPPQPEVIGGVARTALRPKRKLNKRTAS